MCGKIHYEAAEIADTCSACHCDMCRRWTGGPFLGVQAKGLSWQGEDRIAVIQSSDWAERAFCSACGSCLFYRVTAPGPYQGLLSLALGTLDDQRGVTLDTEWFIDKKPEVYALEGERKRVTEAEMIAMFGVGFDLEGG